MVKLNFLKPQARNLLITFVVLLLPLIRERVPLTPGGYEVSRYSPLLLLSLYLRMGDYYPFLLMVGFSLVVYFGVSAILAASLRLFTNKKK
jgi:hypothetical protein